ncbi:molybdopterin-synthase adenylyltransferase MoeB [Brucella pituitosa]|jgi:molybdopterin/thiamine biosynthesis adenylyltransferase|uniref:molybdopterin-synthase adenylyltransferase MoeB n=1 Tax=Brucella TaxID=234 RepID=UPI0004679666|nr:MULTISPECIES: molybdopterin-synthase adenylyltransferase MoeB [Brucella]PQZ49053.1 molybdopterin-synthase adenylyltransferase MoeB [Ochrobactrum sp. MYb19]PRA57742.1 molybdopterin-synthase adenylyltransferase MoeB [Ochrobactrum sp. MYb68]PRA67128.1 molybdopterin-synthase adenylyltransferase MoeB [Ochrobactrum sp. MYb18]PRA75841.1 molybdopterin-synthase adenylyltransferase MoeB [Brucella thiophenivorans]PRA88839.1 molybdopterin-synthase adenylyltransferase MoeB [Ochrobactrum sp. MYb29]PRA92
MNASSKPFSSEELERYARHIVLPEIGGPGQQMLKAARVLIVGAGGLGAPVLQYLAAAGIGTLGLVDDDTVSLSNLQRQVIHDTESVGQAKVDSAKASIARINPHVKVETHLLRLNGENAQALISDYDVVVDGSDNFTTRYALADAAALAQRPLVTGAMGRFDGTVTVLMPYANGADGNPNPSYRDLFPDMPPPGSVPTCAEAGVLGVLPGVIGSLQAMEVIKLVTGIGEPLVGRLLLYNALNVRFETIRYKARKPK